MKYLFPLFLAQHCLGDLPETVDFNDHVQPVLSEYCYHCHGPDSASREPKKGTPLRLDREEYAFQKRANGKPVIIKGDPDASEFIKRILDEEEPMPPASSHKAPLKPEDVALLKKWIKQGAPYEEHWAFIKPVRPDVPKLTWGNNAIDAFIHRKHQKLHLEPNDPAAAHRLIRRITFDITGLPPTPQEVKDFEEAAAQDFQTAVQLAVSRLVKTDGYAEHFARHWLDAARYGDTHGIHNDNYRAIWPYRSWVINAFRNNQNFRDFTINQISGDLLPNPTLEQKIATGFNRCLPTSGEGGAIKEEYEAIYAKDRVETTSAIWLGLTTGCAACHDHKFDPISQKDFYSLSAYFRNNTMDAMDKNQADHPPSIFVPRTEDRAQIAQLDQRIHDLNQSLAQRRKGSLTDAETWITTQGTAPLTQGPTPEVSLPLIVTDKKIEGTIEGQKKSWNFTTATKDSLIGKVAKIDYVDTNFGDIADFEAREQVTFGGFVRASGRPTGSLIARMHTLQGHRGWDLWIEGGKVGAHFIDLWPNKAIKVLTESLLPERKWQHVMITYNGKAKPRESVTIYINGEPVPLRYERASNVDSITPNIPLRLGTRHPGIRTTGDIGLHSFVFYRQILEPEEIFQIARDSRLNTIFATPIEQRNPAQNKLVMDYYFSAVDTPSVGFQAQKQKFTTHRNKLRNKGSMTLIMEEKKGPAKAHVLERGEYTEKGEEVFANIPKLFQTGEKGGSPKDRRHLAEWLVSNDNPLPARVTVNRVWYYFFGRGLVETTEDFGIMGARPTHPELLDYLAVEFMESGWDLHHIIKLITSSATYQQSGKVTSHHREKDPSNLFLARSSRYRMEAEQIRDMALAASGLLVHKIGGPSVKPYQPEGVWESVAMKSSNTRFYQQGTGEDLYRRSLYTFWKRSAPHPTLEILNAPTREVFCVRRDRTNTPLQAFVTLNDPQFIEASRKLAERALLTESTFNNRLDHLTLSFMSRRLENEERHIMKATFDDLLKYYEADAKSTAEQLKANANLNPKPISLAEKLLTVGESPSDPSLKPSELAAWTIIASEVFNFDETLTK